MAGNNTIMREFKTSGASRWRRSILLSTALTMLPWALPNAAFAQAVEANQPESVAPSRIGFEEITVTARRRDESLFDVPVAVSAVSGEYLDRYSLNTVEDVTEMMPGLDLARPAGGSGAGIRIRGIGTDGTDSGFEQSVLTDIDGLQVSRGRALWVGYFDLEQIEVLKGPQSLFFGKNSPAGVISLTSRGATDEFEAYLRVGYEFKADEVYAEGAISGPLGEGLGGRLAVRARNMQGWMRNTAMPMVNPVPGAPLLPGAGDPRLGEREIAGRLTLEYDNGGPFTAELKVLANDYSDDGAVMRMELVHCSSNPPVLSRVGGGVTPDPTNECEPNWTINSSAIPEEVAQNYLTPSDGNFFTDQEMVVASLNLDYDFGNMTLTSISGYFFVESKYLMNNDWSSFASIAANENERYEAFSQELRLASNFDHPFNFMLGAYYQDSSLDFSRSVKLDDFPADPVTGRFQWLNHLAASDGEAVSLFGQLMWDINDQIEASAGLRWTHEEKDGFVRNTFIHPFLVGVFPTGPIPGAFKDNNVSAEATLTWRPSDELMAYVAFKQGYKSGGISTSAFLAPGLTQDQIEFDEETSEGFEIGSRLNLLNNSLRVSGTVFRYTFDDLQINAWDPNTSSFSVRNAAKARQTGAELDIAWFATDELVLTGQVAYNHSRFKSFPVATCFSGQTAAQGCIGGNFQDLSGRPTVNAPDWSANAGFAYTTPVLNDYAFQVTGDAQYKGDYFFIITQSPFAEQDAFVRFNASMRIYPDDQSWELALIGRNLSNKKVITSGQDRPGGVGDLNGVLSRPREVRLEATMRF